MCKYVPLSMQMHPYRFENQIIMSFSLSSLKSLRKPVGCKVRGLTVIREIQVPWSNLTKMLQIYRTTDNIKLYIVVFKHPEKGQFTTAGCWIILKSLAAYKCG